MFRSAIIRHNDISLFNKVRYVDNSAGFLLTGDRPVAGLLIHRGTYNQRRTTTETDNILIMRHDIHHLGMPDILFLSVYSHIVHPNTKGQSHLYEGLELGCLYV